MLEHKQNNLGTGFIFMESQLKSKHINKIFIALLYSFFLVNFNILPYSIISSYAKTNLDDGFIPHFYSAKGKELIVEFSSEYVSYYSTLDSIISLDDEHKKSLIEYSFKPLFKYLFGPLTYRDIGGVKAMLDFQVDWNNAFVNKNNRVVLPYHYKGLWLIANEYADNNITLSIPIPRNEEILFTKNWKNCTDRDPDHQTESFYWYFWDPTRIGCDHKIGEHFDNREIVLKEKTSQTIKTYPEYSRLFNLNPEGKRVMKMTFAFGYINELEFPKPDSDNDLGVVQYRDFLNELKTLKAPFKFIKSESIKLKEYSSNSPLNELTIGKKFYFQKAEDLLEIKVITNAGIDQIDIFAKSFAHDHDNYFAWMGHSRVGSGFDAKRFESMLQNRPEYYTLTSNYQLIYWGGCNSYSYYVDPFFKLKATLDPSNDPKGTRNLDIIANALPSFFILNAKNAITQLKALLDYEHPTSYQEIIQNMERHADNLGTKVLATVIGDEDNK